MKNTQSEKILAHLKQGKTISPSEAIQLFNCWRLSAVIDRLRKQGYFIVTHNEPNQDGKGTHGRYELKMEVTV